MSRPVAPFRTRFRHWCRLTLRWADNDAYGHVNNAIYYQWFDSAVNTMLVEAKLLDIEAGDPIALVVGTSCNYFAPLSFPGEVEVGLAVEKLGRSSVHYALGAFAPGSECAAAAGTFTHVAVDRATRRPVPWPEPWKSVYTSIMV
ncbi:acyl-CoA thioesterase [Sphingomonas astaxanthinifaciens]|uniref:Thioesterase n=1 Tax=Sphingomonas astaxanthinifaciens DSM 22298 TaxID=1123267 RepID=A0ABQ5Z5P1_9SPHN|nr:thioesterase family protein [Sphingomonas astaxanthinifaciens]GLR46955.1 thioesterase [Sphingomonas astaxanthinifaciens DSM 22298]